MYHPDDVVIIKPGLRDPVLEEPMLGIVVSIVHTNDDEPLWNVYSVLIDTKIIDVPARRLIKPSVNQHMYVQN